MVSVTILESCFCVSRAMQGLDVISDEHIALFCKQLLAHSHVVKNLHEFMMRVRKFYKGLDQVGSGFVMGCLLILLFAAGSHSIAQMDCPIRRGRG